MIMLKAQEVSIQKNYFLVVFGLTKDLCFFLLKVSLNPFMRIFTPED